MEGTMLSNSNKRVIEAIFENPVRTDVRWSDVETLLRALGAEVSQGSGSRVRVRLGERRMVFHTPHPQPVLVRDALRSVRRFLIEAGVSP
jgi:HicA toxin of bacterial toxin-antitoxin,